MSLLLLALRSTLSLPLLLLPVSSLLDLAGGLRSVGVIGGGEVKTDNSLRCSPSMTVVHPPSPAGGTRAPSRWKATHSWRDSWIQILAWSPGPTGVPARTAKFRVASACPPSHWEKRLPPAFHCVHPQGASPGSPPPRSEPVSRAGSKCGWGRRRGSRTGYTRNSASQLLCPAPRPPRLPQ